MYLFEQLDLLLEAEEQIQQKKLIQWDKIAAWFRTQQTNIQTRWKQFKLDLQKRFQKEPEKKGIVQKMMPTVQNGCKQIMKGCNDGLAVITGEKDFDLVKKAKSVVDGGLQMVGTGIANILAVFGGGKPAEGEQAAEGEQQPQGQQAQVPAPQPEQEQKQQ